MDWFVSDLPSWWEQIENLDILFFFKSTEGISKLPVVEAQEKENTEISLKFDTAIPLKAFVDSKPVVEGLEGQKLKFRAHQGGEVLKKQLKLSSEPLKAYILELEVKWNWSALTKTEDQRIFSSILNWTKEIYLLSNHFPEVKVNSLSRKTTLSRTSNYLCTSS